MDTHSVTHSTCSYNTLLLACMDLYCSVPALLLVLLTLLHMTTHGHTWPHIATNSSGSGPGLCLDRADVIASKCDIIVTNTKPD